MKNIIQIILITLCMQSCNGQKGKKMNTVKYNRNAILNEKISSCYKKPTDKEFRQKILEVFKIDISKTTKKEINLSIELYPETALKEYNFIIPDDLHPMIPSEEDLLKMDKEFIEKAYKYVTKSICNYNKMIFYNDIAATNWVKKNSSSLIHIVTKYGYIKNKDWLQFAFSKSELHEPYQLERFLFDVKCRGEERGEGGDCNTVSSLRKDMLDKMIEYGAELSQLSTVANMVSNGNQEAYEENKEELYAYLMAHCYKAGQSGIIEYLYDSNPKMIEVFREKDFYGIEDLKDFTDNFYKPQNKRFGLSHLGPDPYISYGVINDPDGYTNLRHGKESSSKVVKRVKTGEKFGIEINKGDWWIVVTEDGTRG
ncbi:hypothetical protein G1K82_12860, partial [Tenacibaculum finnmarkense]|nr:hypothetical protein [Tenacibaculum finnmarkense genomovar ulcerans]MCG8721829.1 hypothetical protein [Tenacibaculum finnmarkense]